MSRSRKSGHVPLVETLPALRRKAREAIAATVATGIEAYRRDIHLPRLVAIDPARLATLDAPAHRAIVARLARSLRHERNRGRAGHWTYDLNRHIALWQAYLAERRQLARLSRR